MTDETQSLETFLDSDADASSISNLRGIVSAILAYRRGNSARDQAAIADQYAAEASTLERGNEQERRLWNHDHWLIYDVIEPTPDNARWARWISDGLRHPSLSDRLCALLPPDELQKIRREVERTVPDAHPRTR